jgi:chromatin segregation and condensation protein Rec8/ScpA/Scc1 (kleisin family)
VVIPARGQEKRPQRRLRSELPDYGFQIGRGLVDQFLAATSDISRHTLCDVAGWLVMAVWLVWLKSRLLLPEDATEVEVAEEAAQLLKVRLATLERIRSAAEWLERQPNFGHDMFGRGYRDDFVPIRPQSTYSDLMLATFAWFQDGRKPEEAERSLPPRLPFCPTSTVWRKKRCFISTLVF